MGATTKSSPGGYFTSVMLIIVMTAVSDFLLQWDFTAIRTVNYALPQQHSDIPLGERLLQGPNSVIHECLKTCRCVESHAEYDLHFKADFVFHRLLPSAIKTTGATSNDKASIKATACCKINKTTAIKKI